MLIKIISKKFFFILLVFLFLFSFAGFIFAENTARPLEVEYPQFGPEEFKPPATVETPIPEYVRYIFFFIIGICGFIALAALIYGGVRYVTSAGNPIALKDAQGQILAAIIGIVILLGSWIILHTISPQFVVLEEAALIPGIPELPAGVWLCEEEKDAFPDVWKAIDDFNLKREDLTKAKIKEIKEKIISEMEKISEQSKESLKEIYEECYLVGGTMSLLPPKIENKAKFVYLVPHEKDGGPTYYGAILYENSRHEGNIYISFPAMPEMKMAGPLKKEIPLDFEPSSIIPFVINLSPDENKKVYVYEQVDYNKGFKIDDKYKMTFPDDSTTTEGYMPTCFNCLNPSPLSIKFDLGSDWIVVLSKETKAGKVSEDLADIMKQSDVFTKSDSNLMSRERITKEDCKGFWLWRSCIIVPAARSIILIGGNIY